MGLSLTSIYRRNGTVPKADKNKFFLYNIYCG